jgi:hypothetical protein
MLGIVSGFATLAKKEAPHVVVTHRYLHRHELATKPLPTTLKEVLSTAIKVINFIRSRSLNHFQNILLRNGSRTQTAPLSYRSSLAFKRTSFKEGVRTKGRSLTFSERKRKPTLETL